MKEFNWKGIDLNLLVAFQSLYITQSVTIAAQKCFVSQSAMSHALQRLRVLLNDPLFERVNTHMEPTQRSHDIAPLVDSLLSSIKSDVLTKKVFIPSEYSGVWKVGLTDYAEQLFSPDIFDAIKGVSPNSQVSFFNVNRSNYQDITDSHQLDVIIGSIEPTSSRFIAQYLYTEQHVCLFDSNIFGKLKTMTLDRLLSVEHALVSPDGSLKTQVDDRLAKLGLERKVSVASRHFLTIKRLITNRRMVCIVPKRFAEDDSLDHHLITAPPPIDIPDFDIKLLFVCSQQHEDKNRWLRDIISRVVC